MCRPYLLEESIRSCGTFFIGVQDRCMYSHTFHFSCRSALLKLFREIGFWDPPTWPEVRWQRAIHHRLYGCGPGQSFRQAFVRVCSERSYIMQVGAGVRMGRSLGEGDVLMDISVGQQLLREIMACYDHKNLDQLDAWTQKTRRWTQSLVAPGGR